MNKLKIVNAEPSNYSKDARAILESVADIVDGPFTRAELLSEIAEADGVIVRLGHTVDEEFLQHGPKLKMVVTATTGLNHVDMKAAENAGVKVLCLRGEYDFLSKITATAEHTWGLLLALIRNVPRAVTNVKLGHWDRNAYLGRDLSGLTIGIIGYGRLGKIVTEYAKVFRMKVLVHDIKSIDDSSVQSVTLADILSESDVVSLHVSLNEGSVGLLGRSQIEQMKQGAYLINTSRGELIDEGALLEALKSGAISGASLDVLCDEVETSAKQGGPLIEYASSHENLLITPHIGGATADSMWKTEIFMAKKVQSFFLR